MLKGTSFVDYTKFFSTNGHGKNDKIRLKYFQWFKIKNVHYEKILKRRIWKKPIASSVISKENVKPWNIIYFW